jgi:hypothetical protein
LKERRRRKAQVDTLGERRRKPRKPKEFKQREFEGEKLQVFNANSMCVPSQERWVTCEM